ncbi:hypothetical protein GCM10022198_11480 [Klugiella xanthotipulae]|uniref:Uncharacterized protein n=1 Tax=Klugiella xanthotipulae TaxID=244735 RepID=A0A543HZ48_9MICO|nr:hypothetical protein [Klugiella xanthotipulae]TQM63540.1 hypothetical protein FB466_1806 [Klugiella xanthotipulae]
MKELTSDGNVRFESLVSDIERVARIAAGASEFEYMLVKLLQLLESNTVDREVVISTFKRLASEWPHGAIEMLEFTMRKLQWPEVQAALEIYQEFGADFRYRSLAKKALLVYEEVWEYSDMYVTYR